ncbi:MAG TPA: tetratricopeptide repeat protein [Cyclobacteriaceae bacterium]
MHKLLFIVLATFLFNGAFAQNEKLKKMEAEGDSAMNKSDYQKAIKIYSKVVKSSKLKERADYLALYKRAVCYYSSSDFHHALEDLNQVIPKIPGLPQARMLRALVYGELDQSEKKKEDLEQALSAEPANPGLLKWRASVYLEDEDYKEAKKDLEVARLFADDSETEMYLGVALYNLGSIDSAFQSLDKAIELDATYLPAYMYASSFSLDQDKYDQAVNYLDFAGRLDPKNTTIYFYKGIALVELEKVDEGCRFLRKAFYAGVDDASGYLKEYCFGVEE